MRIWTVVTGEPSPVDGKATRLLRTGLLAQTLAARGHEVVWFNGTFNHNTKTVRFTENTLLPAEGGLTQAFLHGRPYGGNVSISRICNHIDVALSFLKMAQGMPKPDVIQCSYPPIELAAAVAYYARKHNIPYILDYRDLWPDIIADVAPAPLRPLARLSLLPWTRLARWSARGAAGIVGITRPFLDWACGFAGRKAGMHDRVFHLANGADAATEDAGAFWDAQGVTADKPLFVFSGTLSRRMDLATLIDGAKLLPPDAATFVICGKGEAEEDLKARAGTAPNIVFAGWRNQAELQALMRRARVGLLPYKSSKDFAWSFPNKVGEYFSYGLPILTCLEGEVSKLIAERGCGMTYREGDATGFAQAVKATLSADLAPMKAAAHTLYAAAFNPKTIYNDYADYLESFRQS
ncbi:MAG: glycosyltransferase family 4 protein [Alphaproteobacteria bacterium]|nr:glycosyltransferase family 4 protein [Alphaproteobacteria bacterium]